MTPLEVLIVEDDLDARANLRDILELDGHRVWVAGSAAEARQQASLHTPSVVILDRRLPDGTADQVLPEIRERLPTAEVIVVTGFADMESTIAAIRHGAADYLLKPVHPDALRNSLKRIAEQRRVEQELRQEQQFANRILETAEAVVLVLDLDGSVISANPYFHRITSWSVEELRGKDWFDHCIAPEDQDRLREVFLRTAQNMHTSGVINAVVTKDGHQRQIRWSNTTLKDDTGQVSSVLAVGVDVTDLLQAQELALRSQRLAAIGQTMAALAHESRNALQRIQAGVELLQLEMGGREEARKDLKAIERAANDLNNLLEEVRSFAGPIHLHIESANLADVWRRAWDDLAAARTNRQAVLIESTSDIDLMCPIDTLRLELVFRNLFENSLAACTDPVTIQVSCQVAGNGDLSMMVCDNGPGLCRESREKLFEPFFTTKSAGTGLGMSIVQRIIQAHGGEIEVAKQEQTTSFFLQKQSCGAAFVIRLPSQITQRKTG